MKKVVRVAPDSPAGTSTATPGVPTWALSPLALAASTNSVVVIPRFLIIYPHLLTERPGLTGLKLVLQYTELFYPGSLVFASAT
ncbi:MAG: hypothetical protein IMW99_01470 [Firmicutes bacterium]|nr:hypothetical protein [Bacillota bacterium]